MKLVIEVEGSFSPTLNEWLVYDNDRDIAYIENTDKLRYCLGYTEDWFFTILEIELDMGRGVGQAWEED